MKKTYKNSREWVCDVCGLKFFGRAKLLQHKKEIGHKRNLTFGTDIPFKGTCNFCGYLSTSKYGLTNHINCCKLNPNRKDGNWKGRKHKKESIEKVRLGFVKSGKCKTNFNKIGCNYIDKLNKERGWNLQHALKGGEFTICGFYLDGYDCEKNIVFEYDEEKHYLNYEVNLLQERDIKRQNRIIEKLNCEFWRYNEKKNELYRVN